MMRVMVISGLLTLAMVLPVSATIINVPGDSATIQGGINGASFGDTVLVQPGTYVENIYCNRHGIVLGSLFLTTGDTSYISTTIIDGDSAESVVRFDGLANSTNVICGFTIQNGFAQYGGGIFSFDSNPQILSNIITDNIASDSLGMNGRGGGIYCWDCSEPLIENNIIFGNMAGSDSGGNGGGISFYGPSNGIIRNNRIIGNLAVGNGSPYTGTCQGGGIECRSSSPTITGNVITGNSAWECGGGIYLTGHYGEVSANIITDNFVRLDGGGIGINGGVPTIEDNIIMDNDAQWSGGGIYLWGSNASIISNIIGGNSCVISGGGIHCFQWSSPTIAGNLLKENDAGRYGGGISIASESHPQLNQNTIHLNSASIEGGGFYSAIISNPIITNTIIWSNSAPINNEISIFGGSPTFSYCDIKGGWPGEGNIDCCPGFCSTPIDDYHLTPTSCCLGSGSGGGDIGAYGLGCDSLTPNCSYVIGDVNGSDSYNGLDITYGVSYLKGGEPPVYECECTSCNIWYASGDVNGSCSYNGLDITYGVNYFKGGADPIPCPDCPPVE